MKILLIVYSIVTSLLKCTRFLKRCSYIGLLLYLLCNGIYSKTSQSQLEYSYDSLISMLQECTQQNNKACEDLLNLGIPNPENCDSFTCNIIGITLSFANKESQALGYFKTACNARYMESCFGLALSYESLKDYHNAKLIYQLACERNHIISCYNLAMLYLRDDLGKQDYIVANTLFQKACSRMYAKACFNRAVLYSNGNGVKKDLSYAKLYFDKACDMGLQESCKHFNTLDKQGIQMPKPRKVRGFYLQDF